MMDNFKAIILFIINFTLCVLLAICLIIMKIGYDKSLRDLRIEQKLTIDHNNDLHDTIEAVLNTVK